MVRLLNKEGRLSYRVGIKRVSRIMKINGIRADYRQPKKDRQGAKQTYQDENLLNRQFKQEKPNQVWVTDTTELTYGTANKVRLHASIWTTASSMVNLTNGDHRSRNQSL